MNNDMMNAPASDLASPKRKKRLPLILAVSAASIAAVIAVIVTVMLLLPKRELLPEAGDAFRKSFGTIPQSELDRAFMKLLNEGGSIRVDATLGNDIFEALGDQTLGLSGTLQMTKEMKELSYECSLHSEAESLDAGFFMDDKGFQIFSDRLFENAGYHVDFDGFSDALSASPFAPQSGSEYAMKKEEYDALVESVERYLEDRIDENDRKVLVELYKKIYDAVSSHIVDETETGTVQIDNTRVKNATLHEITLGHPFLLAFVTVLRTELEEREDLRALVEKLERMEILTAEKDEPVLDAILRTLKTYEKDYEKYASWDPFSITFSYIIKDGYMIYFRTELWIDERYEKPMTYYFTLAFPEEPTEEHSVTSMFGVEEDGKRMLTCRLVYAHTSTETKKTEQKLTLNVDGYDTYGRYTTVMQATLSMTTEKDGGYQLLFDFMDVTDPWRSSGGALSANGEYKVERGTATVTVTDLVTEKRSFAMTDRVSYDKSRFSITVTPGWTWIGRKNTSDLLALSEAELDCFVEKVKENYRDFAETVNKECGKEVLSPSLENND